MTKGETQRYRHHVRSDHPPSAVQGVACSLVQNGMMIVAHLFSEYLALPEEHERPAGGDGAVKIPSEGVIREFLTPVMLTPETAIRIAEGLRSAADEAIRARQQVALATEPDTLALPPAAGSSS